MEVHLTSTAFRIQWRSGETPRDRSSRWKSIKKLRIRAENPATIRILKTVNLFRVSRSDPLNSARARHQQICFNLEKFSSFTNETDFPFGFCSFSVHFPFVCINFWWLKSGRHKQAVSSKKQVSFRRILLVCLFEVVSSYKAYFRVHRLQWSHSIQAVWWRAGYLAVYIKVRNVCST